MPLSMLLMLLLYTQVLVAKLDGATGSELWVYSSAENRAAVANGCAYALKLDAQGNPSVVGSTSGTAAQPAKGPTDAYLLVLDGRNGDALCYHQLGSAGDDAMLAVSVCQLLQLLIALVDVVLVSLFWSSSDGNCCCCRLTYLSCVLK
jgi:hypothetical protein